MIKLYHGSNIEIKTPNLKFSRKELDFGAGFYTTTNYDQAKEFSEKIVERIIPTIIDEFKLSEEEAIHRFYNSKLYSFLENPKTGIWRYSPKLLFNLYKVEIETGVINFPEEAA